MGYPMTYRRVLHRNGLDRTIAATAAGLDLRRLEHDQRDARHLRAYAAIAGITPEQAKRVLDAFFETDEIMAHVAHEMNTDFELNRMGIDNKREPVTPPPCNGSDVGE